MPNPYFQFKQFTVRHDRCAMKVTTDACLFGAWTAARFPAGKESFRVLDVGGGSGLLSLMLAQAWEPAQIDCLEIDENAAQQAMENVSSSPWKERIRVIRGDARNYLPGTGYDIVISNPPFYENELRSGRKEKDSAHHDETLRLSELLSRVPGWLLPGGTLFLILPFKRKNEWEKMAREEGWHAVQTCMVRPSVHHDFFRMMLAVGREKGEGERTEEMSIKNSDETYTELFVRLLKEYYLHL